jgi:hypothetical protein
MNLKVCLYLMGLTGSLLVGALPLRAQDARSPKEIIQTAVKTELAADRDDHSLWRYRVVEKDADNSVSIVVETSGGSVKRLISRAGQPLSAGEAQAEEQRIQNLIHDPEKLARRRKDAAQDDKNAKELLNMLPDAFNWKVQSEDAEKITLHFQPNPEFSPPDMQSRVLGEMLGELVVDREQNRIETISGRLVQDVTIGWGLLGRLHEGGTFRVERRQIGPKLWQITETHVHIEGRALLFKNIGQQQDEVETDFTPVPAGTTLEQAAEMSKSLK